MKSVLISINPKFVDKIVSGEKTIEVRKTAPKEVPFKAYIYCSYGDMKTNYYLTGRGKVIGEFICDKVYNLVNAFGGIVFADENLNQLEPQLFRDMSCLTDEQTADYLGNKDGYGWHISDLKIYDKPKELNEFCIPCKTNCEDCKKPLFYDCWKEKGKIKVVTRPPQSYMYVEDVKQ